MQKSEKLTERATKAWVLALVSVASFMIFLDAMVVTTALSTIRLDLDASIEALEWTVNAYNLTFAVLLLTGAAIGSGAGACSPQALRSSSRRRPPARWRAVPAG
jgi:MFS family permease